MINLVGYLAPVSDILMIGWMKRLVESVAGWNLTQSWKVNLGYFSASTLLLVFYVQPSSSIALKVIEMGIASPRARYASIAPS
jgi:hypothetical protein